MSKARPLSLLFFVSSSLVASASLPGCGGGASPSSLCDAAFDCGSLSKTEYDSCVANGESFQKQAENTGCEPQFEEAIACAVDEGICNNGQFSAVSCDNKWEAFMACAGIS